MPAAKRPRKTKEEPRLTDEEITERLQRLIDEYIPPEPEKRDGYGISKGFYSVLGLVVAEWARAEELLGYLCFLLFEIEPPLGVPLVANLGYRSRVHILQAVTDLSAKGVDEMLGADTERAERTKKRAAEIRALLIELDELYPKRNACVHCFYVEGVGEHGARVFAARVRGRLRYETGVITADDLWDIYLKMHNARVKLARLVAEYDVKGYFHEAQPEEGASPETVGTPFVDPTSSAPPTQPSPLRNRDEAPHAPKKPKPKRLSSAQKRTLREKGELL